MRKPHWELMTAALPPNAFRWIEVRGVTQISNKIAVIRRAIAMRMAYPDVDPAVISKAVGELGVHPNEWVGDSNLGREVGLRSTDWITYTGVAMWTLFKGGRRKIYKIAREFGEQLAKVNLDISADLLQPMDEIICIEFPESIRFYDSGNDDYFHCAYVTSERASKEYQPVNAEGMDVFHQLSLLIPCWNEKGQLKQEENHLVLTFTDAGESIESALDRAHRHSTHPINCPDAIRFILKCLVYLQSGDPDLREYRAPRPKTENPKKVRRFLKEHANESMVDMTLVGFSFKKPRTYLVNEVAVTGHFRWQPYGTHRDKVKLIWIEPHLRHYGSQEEEDAQNDGGENG